MDVTVRESYMDPSELIQLLNLKPLPHEGGFFAETYRSYERIEALPHRYDGGTRAFSTAIYYLLTPDTFSAMHRLPSDELYHFYLGDTVEILQLYEDGTGTITKIGNDLASGVRPQVIIPRGVWQGSRLVSGGKVALLGTTVAPGFEFTDFESGRRDRLLSSYPQFAEMITALTRE